MEFQAIGKRYSRFGLWNKCIVRIVNDTVTFSKPKSKKNDNTILVSKDTQFDIEKNDGKDRIIVKDNLVTIKFMPKTNLLECFMALKSTKFANTRLHLDDFLIMAKIGQGSFGSVSLVQHRLSKEIFAMKCINKNHLYKTKMVRTVLSERKLLEQTCECNRFLIKMEFAFQNATDFYIGLEYAPGGDMRRLISRHKKISISDIRIYLSEIAICLNSLHHQKIIYRDLKPENILITSSGHIKIADLGLSKDISIVNSTSTFCGTLCYMAPEIVSHHSYSYEADWYQLGVVAYELAYGHYPFFDENRKKTMEKIISEEAVFPTDSDPLLVDLIKNLLEKDPNKRLNFEGLRNHSFFANFSFDDANEKKYAPSFIPIICHPADTRYFSPDFDSESDENEISTNDLNLFEGFSFVSNEFNKLL